MTTTPYKSVLANFKIAKELAKYSESVSGSAKKAAYESSHEANFSAVSSEGAKSFVGGKNKSIAKLKNKAANMLKSFAKALFLTALVTSLLFAKEANSTSRIKDIVNFEGIRENTLIGYGLVIGLNGTGDNLRNVPFTEKGLSDFLTKLGINSKGTDLKTKNVAAVMITATLPAFARSGSKINVQVGTLGDSKSIEGGILLASPLLGADGEVYAVAQGQIVSGGIINDVNSSNALSKAVPTSGTIPNGATIERETSFKLSSMESLKIALHNPDISTAKRVAQSINHTVGEDAATALDPGTIQLRVPALYEDNVIGLLADIEQIKVETDQVAKVVIDEASGTIVMGEDVKINTVAVAQGNLLVSINNDIDDGDGSKFTTDSKEKDLNKPVNNNDQPGNGFAVLSKSANLRDLVSGLNALGVGTRDLINILQTIKVAGALHADIEVR